MLRFKKVLAVPFLLFGLVALLAGDYVPSVILLVIGVALLGRLTRGARSQESAQSSEPTTDDAPASTASRMATPRRFPPRLALAALLVIGIVTVVSISNAGAQRTLLANLKEANEALATGNLSLARTAAEKAVSGAKNKPDLRAEAETILQKIATAERLVQSAKDFATGKTAYDAGSFGPAFRALKSVVPEDPNYAGARTLLAQSVPKAVEDFCASLKFQAAKDILAEARDLGVVSDAKASQLEKTITQAEAAAVARQAVAAAKAEQERREAERLAAIIGPKPQSSAWDGSVEPVMRYLRENLKDPKSLDVAEWSPVSTITLGGEPYWAVRCKYRAKNSFGGYVIENKVFLIRQNTVVRVVDY